MHSPINLLFFSNIISPIFLNPLNSNSDQIWSQSVLTLSDQLEYFKEYIGKLKAIIGEENTTFTITNSLFIVVAGSDDIANTYFTLRARELKYDVPAYTDLMANSASSFVQVSF